MSHGVLFPLAPLNPAEMPSPDSFIMSSTSSGGSCGFMAGGDCVVLAVDSLRGGASLSITCFRTSASRQMSASTGAPSSASAARIRAKPFVLGCYR